MGALPGGGGATWPLLAVLLVRLWPRLPLSLRALMAGGVGGSGRRGRMRGEGGMLQATKV
jgi:hypothetical protein